LKPEDDIREALILLQQAYSESGDDWLKDAANIRAAGFLKRHAKVLQAHARIFQSGEATADKVSHLELAVYDLLHRLSSTAGFKSVSEITNCEEVERLRQLLNNPIFLES